MHGETDLPLPARPLPHSSQTAFVCFCRDIPGAVLNQTVATVWSDLVQVCSHLWLTAQYLLHATFTC